MEVTEGDDMCGQEQSFLTWQQAVLKVSGFLIYTQKLTQITT